MQDKRKQAIDALLSLKPIIGKRFFSKVQPPPRESRKVNQAQYFILVELHKNGPQRMSVLAKKCNVSCQQLSALADGLTEMNFLTRDTDETCRRSIIARITEEGTEFIKAERERMLNVALTQLGEISDEALDRLYESARTIIEILDDEEVSQ